MTLLGSNYADYDYDGDTLEDAPEVPVLIRCGVCHGSGLEIVDGYETDCINCEGEGYVEVSAIGPRR